MSSTENGVRSWLYKHWQKTDIPPENISAIQSAIEQGINAVISELTRIDITIRKGKLKEFERVRVPELIDLMRKDSQMKTKQTTIPQVSREQYFPEQEHEKSKKLTDKQENSEMMSWISQNLCRILGEVGRGKTIDFSQVPHFLTKVLDGYSIQTQEDFYHMTCKVNEKFLHQYGVSVKFASDGFSSDNQENLWKLKGELMILREKGSYTLGETVIPIEVLERVSPERMTEGSFNAITGVLDVISTRQVFFKNFNAVKERKKNGQRIDTTDPNILIGEKMYRELQDEYGTAEQAYMAYQRQTVTHELRHLKDDLETFGIGRSLTHEERLAATNKIISPNERSELRQLLPIPPRGKDIPITNVELVRNQMIHDVVIEEMTAHMTGMIECPRAILLKHAIWMLQNEPRSLHPLGYLINMQCINALIGMEFNICSKDDLKNVWCISFHKKGIDFAPRMKHCNLAQRLAEFDNRDLRLAIKRVYEREFGRDIDEPPFAKIGQSGNLESYLQIDEKLLKS